MEYIFIAFAGFAGGALIVSSGGGSFITYPALLAVGLPGTVANATSTVGLFAGWSTSVFNFQKDAKKHKQVIRILVLPALVGALFGSWLLTKTPESIFAYVAPILILIGSLALAYKDSIITFSHRIHLRSEKRKLFAVGILTFVVCSYSSFFGAGVGILMLACLSILEIPKLIENIAIKNVLIIIGNGVAVVYFLFSGLLSIEFALALACGSIPGAYFGSRFIHVVKESYLRLFTVIFGVVASVLLLSLEIYQTLK